MWPFLRLVSEGTNKEVLPFCRRISDQARGHGGRIPADAKPRFSYNPNVNCGVLLDGLLRVEIYGQDFVEVMNGLIAYTATRIAPTSGSYDWEPIKQRAWELLKDQLAGMHYTSIKS